MGFYVIGCEGKIQSEAEKDSLFITFGVKLFL